MADDPEGLVTFEAAGKKYTAVFGFRAMKAVETHYDLPFFQAIRSAMPAVDADETDKAKILAAAASVRFSDLGVLFGFSLLKHHPDLTETAIEDLVDEVGLERVSSIIGQALSAALVKEGDEDSDANPPPGRRKR